MKEEVKILKPRALKTIALLLLSILAVAEGIFITGTDPFVAWMTILLFGMGVIAFVIQLMPNSSYLKMTKDGFEVRNLYRSNFTKWSDVKNFRSRYTGRSKMVMYDFSNKNRDHKTGKKIAKFLSGSEAALPNTYGMRAKDLAELMNEWKSNSSIPAQQT